jgi:hypothetical protein
MAIGAGILLVAIGILVWLLLNPVLGIILTVIGVAAVLLSFAAVGPFARRRETIIVRDRDSRAVRETVPERERETIREERF